MQPNRVMMPTELTAENGAKALLSGEFFEEVTINCEDCEFVQEVPVSWENIKAIYAKAVKHFSTQESQE